MPQLGTCEYPVSMEGVLSTIINHLPFNVLTTYIQVPNDRNLLLSMACVEQAGAIILKFPTSRKHTQAHVTLAIKQVV